MKEDVPVNEILEADPRIIEYRENGFHIDTNPMKIGQWYKFKWHRETWVVKKISEDGSISMGRLRKWWEFWQ